MMSFDTSTCRFISPVVIAPTIIMVGFGHFEYGFPGVSIYFQIPAALDIENHCVIATS
jgi:hypothetical protein